MTDKPITDTESAVDAAINKRLVGFLVWLIILGLANFGAITGGIVFAAMDRQNIISGQADRWTGTMAQVAELERQDLNSGYNKVNIRRIQEEHFPK